MFDVYAVFIFFLVMGQLATICLEAHHTPSKWQMYELVRRLINFVDFISPSHACKFVGYCQTPLPVDKRDGSDWIFRFSKSSPNGTSEFLVSDTLRTSGSFLSNGNAIQITFAACIGICQEGAMAAVSMKPSCKFNKLIHIESYTVQYDLASHHPKDKEAKFASAAPHCVEYIAPLQGFRMRL